MPPSLSSDFSRASTEVDSNPPSTAKDLTTNEKEQPAQPGSATSDQQATTERQRQQIAAAAAAGAKWGVTPSKEARDRQWPPESDPAKMPPDHPVHRVPAATIEKWRRKRINPVARAEMDATMAGAGREGRFWVKLGGTAMGGGWIK